MDEERASLTQSLIDLVNEIASIHEYRSSVKKQYCNLARRLKLLTPMFEEIRESKEPMSEEIAAISISLKDALISAKELLRFGSEGSKIYLVLERDHIMHKFHEVTAQLEQALDAIPFEKLDISDEVKEQVELVLAQFRRAKGREDAADDVLYEDLLSLYNKRGDAVMDPTVLRRLAEKLQLMGIAELAQESLALHEMVSATGGDPEETIEKMSNLLREIKHFVQTENPNLDAMARETLAPPSSSGQTTDGNQNTLVIPDLLREIKHFVQTENPNLDAMARETLAPPNSSGQTTDGNQNTLVIPDDFRCPISLELMKDPVIVSTGQTYERACIEKWLDAGHGTCPKTQQALTSTILTPNYVLRSLIAQWCEANGIEPPRPSSSRSTKTASSCSPAERIKIIGLLWKLTSGSPEDQRAAAAEIRLLAKRNADNRVAIAEAGAIPLLVGLLSTPDLRTQEHAVTALLNLSICEENKGIIVSSGAVPGIVQVLKKGSMEARENAAATLFSLSVLDANKVTIGGSGAIPPLVTLLSEGTQRGKKDAATALFNLCIYQGNKGKAVRAGVVPTLMRLLTEPGGGMVDEALAILAILSSHPEGKAAIGGAEAVVVLVDVITNGSPRNKENAAAVMVHLCSGDPNHLAQARDLGVTGPLVDLAQNGTDRGKRKAAQLLERLSRFVEQQKLAQSESQSQSQPQTVDGQGPF